MKKAFTLAEVLITLVVIGIVAAITINIIFNNQEEAYKSCLKKSFSVLQQAFRKATIDNGGFFPVGYGEDPNQNIIKIGDAIFKSNMKVVKDCYKDTCFWEGEQKISNYNGTTIYTTYKSNYVYKSSVILQDGTFFQIDSYSKLGTDPTYSYIYVLVDVNGLYKWPNRLGKDVFYLEYDVRNEKLNPHAENLANMDICSKSSTDRKNGIGCADLIRRGQKLPW